MRGYLRPDGRKGIRDRLLVVYLVDCARHVADEIAEPFQKRGVYVVGFSNCYPSAYGQRMLEALTTHPNVGGALLVSLGCESFRKLSLERTIRESGRLTEVLTIQKAGGTRATIAAGEAWLDSALSAIRATPRVPLLPADLIIGVTPGDGGGDTYRSLGRVVDELLEAGGTVILDDPAKGRDLVSCAINNSVRRALTTLADRAASYRRTMGSCWAEASTVANVVSAAPVVGLLRPSDRPRGPGLYLLDNVPDGEPRYGHFDINPYVEMAEMAACGAHAILAGTDSASLAGAAVTPVVKLCGDPERAQRFADEIDIAGSGVAELEAVSRIADGTPTASERLNHYAFTLVHKNFERAAAT